jgi:sugar-specific transcriptional regulator TrmB
MDTPEEALLTLGLSPTETKIYVTGLQYASITAQDLAKQTKVKRTSVYHALHSLLEKGLVTQKKNSDKLSFVMSDPDELLHTLERNISQMESKRIIAGEIVRTLKNLKKEKIPGIKVSHYEGENGMETVTDEIVYCKSRHLDIIAPAKNFFSEYDKKIASYFMATRKQRGVTARSLWEKVDSDRRTLTPEEIRMRNPRILPKSMHGKFSSIIFLFDDKVVFISSAKEVTAISIQSPAIHDTMQAVFETLWENSTPYKT